MSSMSAGLRFLVTGAGGSIGSQIVMQLLELYNPEHVTCLDISEYNLYALREKVQSTWIGGDIDYCLADIRHTSVIEHVMGVARPNVVIHAAALKHVPMLETEHNSLEAIRTNVLGTRELLRSSADHKASLFLLVSTDKAVKPHAFMGKTKAYAEKLTRHVGRTRDMNTSIVRFGNVVGSSGSVVPKFHEQIADGGPVTVTSRKMERYLMSISQAVSLVLDAADLSYQQSLGETFMLEMGEPWNMWQLAETMVLLSGKDVEIHESGLRPGEKLQELLCDPQYEQMVPTHIDGLYRVHQLMDTRRARDQKTWEMSMDLYELCEDRKYRSVCQHIDRVANLDEDLA